MSYQKKTKIMKIMKQHFKWNLMIKKTACILSIFSFFAAYAMEETVMFGFPEQFFAETQQIFKQSDLEVRLKDNNLIAFYKRGNNPPLILAKLIRSIKPNYLPQNIKAIDEKSLDEKELNSIYKKVKDLPTKEQEQNLFHILSLVEKELCKQKMDEINKCTIHFMNRINEALKEAEKLELKTEDDEAN